VLSFAINNMRGFKNWHKYHVINESTITLIANECIYIYIKSGGSIPHDVNFGLRKVFRNRTFMYLENCLYIQLLSKRQ
jgi:hypothetical protein